MADIEVIQQEPVFLPGGLVLPTEFVVTEEIGSGVTVSVDVLVDGTRATARAVQVASPEGVGSGTLRRVQVREIVANGCRGQIQRVEVVDGAPRFVPATKNEGTEVVIQRLVGYIGGRDHRRTVTDSVGVSDEVES